ncbi:unnamed protein product, partial [Musa textilis]
GELPSGGGGDGGDPTPGRQSGESVLVPTASQVMAANPGHYVAVIIVAPPPSALNSAASSPLLVMTAAVAAARGLLRANDTLHIGHVYRLVSFQDGLREFASKGHVKLSRLLAKPTEMTSSSSTRGNGSGAASAGGRRHPSRRVVEPVGKPATVRFSCPSPISSPASFLVLHFSTAKAGGAAPARHGRWRPALRSIAEVGS